MPIDLPALLSPGFTDLTLTELHRIAVAHPRFVLSKTRDPIMRSLWTFSACLTRWNFGQELWIDGSFLTEKIDPRDVDVSLVLPEDFYNTASEDQLGIWDWLDDTDDPKRLLRCHTFILPKSAAGDPDYVHYVRQEAFWRRWFGTSRDGSAKGIGRILLPNGCV